MNRVARIAIVTVAFLVTLVVTVLGIIDIQVMLLGRELYETHSAGFVLLCGISFFVGAAISFCVAYGLTKALGRPTKVSN